MLWRSILEISSRQSLRRIPRQITTQGSSFLSSRKEFSSASQQNASQGAGSTGKSSGSGSQLSKVVIGSFALGAVVVTAYQTGYLDQIIGKDHPSSYESSKVGLDKKDAKGVQQGGEHIILPNNEETNKLSQNVEHPEPKVETHDDLPHLEGLSEKGGESQSSLAPVEDKIPIEEKNLPNYSHTPMTSNDQSTNSGISSEGSHDMRSLVAKANVEPNEKVQVASASTEDSTVHKENETSMPQHLTAKDTQQVQVPFEAVSSANVLPGALGQGFEAPSSLLDEYHLRDKNHRSVAAFSQGTNGYEHFSKGKEASVSAMEDLKDAYISEDGKLVLDFLQTIHAAEKRQSELDAHVFNEERRMMKEKYEKELKDARVRELMYAEEAAILDKELNKERAKVAAAIKSLQEKAEEKLKMELEQKESEAELKLKKVQELAKAELAAAIASEKASQIEKMAEANLHINALCMAFYAQSEEARQSHSVHKLALGALVLEDALSKGQPIQAEIEALHSYLEGIDRDSLLDLVISSLPEETRNHGTDGLLQLHQKFDALKGTLRHFSLIPPGGGGILAHSLAHIAAWLKVREADPAGDGIESVIYRVESYLAEGKLAEAADTLEEGARGSQAAEIVGDWVRRARNRAVTEQALTLLQSYTTSISLT
ncbi:MICOS complex subunit MIC60, mitochondrial [Malania oleifera]|uniref:MICOS complex subunit MIC60, mitochondrial n=1 Tax=Malania oleifera TaxID=397392 RepID=UPI0025AE7E91|nr:MICOS complex subunit MIC60, mitochondrial [Malania oleifera]